jgi:oligoribonuclease
MPAMASGVSKQSAHLARADVHESINELRYYREHMFVKP